MSVSISRSANVFTLTKKTKEGKVQDSQSIEAVKPMSEQALSQSLGTMLKTAGKIRHAALSFLAGVYVRKEMDGFRMSGDKTTGKVSKEYKAAVRSAEEGFVRQLVTEGALKLKDEPAIQTWLSDLREDKNYSNAKVTTSRYVAFVKETLLTDDGYLIPVEVMKQQLSDSIDKEPVDNSLYGKLLALKEFMDNETVDPADARKAASLARSIATTLQGIADADAAKSTNMGAETRAPEPIKAAPTEAPKAEPVNVPALADALISAVKVVPAVKVNVDIPKAVDVTVPKMSKVELLSQAAKAHAKHAKTEKGMTA